MSYGDKIASLRKRSGMTQAELGEHLNITSQAVSKWERDESDPDFSTMSKIAKIFNVPLSFFDNDVDTETALASPAQAAVDPEAEAAALKKALEEHDRYLAEKAEREQAERAQQERARAQQEYERKKQLEKDAVLKRRNRGLIISAIITGIVLIASIVGMATNSVDAVFYAVVPIVVLLFVFPFVAQIFWDGFILGVVFCGIKIFGMPGVIFTLDLDGILFLIAMKILFAVLKFFLLIITFMFFAFIAMILSPFTFLPAVLKLSRGEEL